VSLFTSTWLVEVNESLLVNPSTISRMLSDLLSSLSTNPYFGAGAGLLGIGTVLAVARRSSQYGLIFFRRQFMITLEVPNNDISYTWLLQWISHQLRDSSRHLSARTTLIKNDDPSSRIHASYTFVPSVGKHYFRYKGKFIQVERTREQMINSGVPFESVQLTAFGQDRQIYVEMLERARDAALLANEGKTLVYIPTSSFVMLTSCSLTNVDLFLVNEWRMFGQPRRKRPLNSVILDKGIMTSLVNDVEHFLGQPNWYIERGIPYRRGYLLHGPPGSGKTSAIMAIAGDASRDQRRVDVVRVPSRQIRSEHQHIESESRNDDRRSTSTVAQQCARGKHHSPGRHRCGHRRTTV
jgi:mitochondrial chaperone BCS1